MITRKQLIEKFLKFFESKKHKIIPSASLIPENDPTVLFTTAGMHPLVPYLLGQKHPLGKRLADVQKCIRTGDIDEVGDTFHHTFFEMLGNWSLGDYGKKEAIEFSFEFLTKVLKIPLDRLAVTVFGGDKRVSQIPVDKKSSEIWEKLGISKDRIAFVKGGVLESTNNWWGPAGKTGPCGPDTEMFYWKLNSKPAPKKFDPEDENWVEIWNDVIMEYVKDKKGNYNEANQKNIDTGMGVERTTAILNGLEDNYLGDSFLPIIKEIEKLSGKKYGNNKDDTRIMRIIADHIKAAVFMIADGVIPSNTEQGYILRRLIRRAIRYGKDLGIPQEKDLTTPLTKQIVKIYDDYDEIKRNKQKIIDELNKEEDKFEKTLEEGLRVSKKIMSKKKPIDGSKFSELMKDPNKAILIGRIFELKEKNKDYSLKKPKISQKEIDAATIEGNESFLLYQSYGFPLEMVDELAMANGLIVSHNAFRKELEKHQELSRTATAGKFKSGLADDSEATTRLHTAAHLLLQALKIVLKDENIEQRGSNINPERLRLDFSFDRKLTEKEIKDIEDLVNAQIEGSCDIIRQEMSPEQAKAQGACGIFDKKYGEIVSVYTIGDFSKEICTGPHVKKTCELGHFKIVKEQSSSSGVRRIKAILE